MSIVLEGNGGTFPDGSGTLTLEPINGFVHLPDWSTMDRPGYRLTGWTASDGAAVPMGEKVGDGAYTAVWAEDPTRYSTDFLPMCAVRIYRSIDEYADVTGCMTALPVIEKAENRGGSATFSVAKGVDAQGVIDPAGNPVAPSYAGWNKGEVGGIRPGMYVWFGNVGTDGIARYIFDGFVTTVEGGDTSVSVTVGDRISFLGKSGTWLRRNYRGSSRAEKTLYSQVDEEGKKFVDMSELPADATVDAIYWGKDSEPADIGSAVTANGPMFPLRQTVMAFRLTFPVSGERIRSLSFDMPKYPLGTSVSGTATLDGIDSQTIDWAWSGSEGNFQLPAFEFSAKPRVKGRAVFTLYINVPKTSGKTTNFTLRGCESDDCEFFSPYMMVRTSPTSLVVQAATLNFKPHMTITYVDSVKISGTYSGDRFYPEDPEDLTDPATVVFVSGTAKASRIISDISEACGMIPVDRSSITSSGIAIFRVGGAYALDYLKKLADTSDDGGNSLSFGSRGFVTPFLMIGDRRRTKDGAEYCIHFGGDSVVFDPNRMSPYISFDPRITMKNRPSMITLKGTASGSGNTETIQVTVENPSSTSVRGVCVESITSDNAVNDLKGAMQSAYAELSSTELDEWEGDISIPISAVQNVEFIHSGGQFVGSGKNVLVVDGINGINETLHVKDETIDYSDCVLKLTLSNHSLRYSNDLLDTQALAITSADISTGATDSTLFDSQYVFLKTDIEQNIVERGNIVKIHVDGLESPIETETPSIFVLPGGSKIIVATVRANQDIHASSDKDYAVNAISVNGNTPTIIDRAVRPDFFNGQILTICLEVI